MKQPIKQHIQKNHPLSGGKDIYTLLVDGNNLLEISFAGDKRVNENGVHIGGIFQFLLQLKMMLRLYDFSHCYVFWDGDKSGQMRYRYYNDYKANRDKSYSNDNISDYDKKIDDFVKRTLSYYNKKKILKNPEKEAERESFNRQKERLMMYLEELFIRQNMDDESECDDLIAYYTLHKKSNEKIIIMSGDRDLTQLINDDVCVYIPTIHKFVTPKNHREIMGFHYENVLLKKIIVGDTSDNIKGIKGVGEKTFYELFPEVKERKVTLNEVIDKACSINNDRANKKLKPLKSCFNIINRVTDGIQGDKIYEINEKIINLKKPLMTENAINSMNEIMNSPIDPDNRTPENLYKLIKEDCIRDLTEGDNFSNFFSVFNGIKHREIIMYNNFKNEK